MVRGGDLMNNFINYIYTWKDVERIFNYYNRNNKFENINYIDVYYDEMVVYLTDIKQKDKANAELENILGYHYDLEKECIYYDIFEKKMNVFWEEDNSNNKNYITPLFKNIIYRNNSYDNSIINDKSLENCPVIAFHSYKGGVGRTLSLIAFAKAWSSNLSNQKILIIDADIEAPGFTWVWDNEGNSEFSYLDLLEIIQTSDFDNDLIRKKVVEQVQLQTMKIYNERKNLEYYFLPTYRYREQLLDIYANPESIASAHKSRYSLAEKISRLGEMLGASAVFIDLRAGLSEFSAPLLFDMRVKKYIVSSTSYQSIRGTKLILNEMLKGLQVKENTIVPQILLTMVTKDIDTDNIQNELLELYDNQDYIDNAIIELPFASELIHLQTLEDILQKLEGRDFYYNISKLVNENYVNEENENNLETKIDNREEIITRIHETAENQINAEMNNKFNVLLTKPIKNLIRVYSETVPQAVVIGAKGAGKTFLFRELLIEKTWNKFCKKHGNINTNKMTSYIIPLIAPKSLGEINGVLQQAIKNFNKECDFTSKDTKCWHRNSLELTEKISKKSELLEWKKIWIQCILNNFADNINMSLNKVEEVLENRNCNVMFVVDGLEEIFENTIDNENEKKAIRALVQEVLNEIKILYPHIGLLVFLRKDLVNNCIETNTEQFEGQNKRFALNWSHDEALRLALWLVCQAVPEFYDDKETKIEEASKEVIKNYLVKLWGLKLGKKSSNEAYSSRWILAALSDFNAQLQARDIIRFLASATSEIGNVTYDDRIIMPKEVKNAVHDCSDKKIQEIKQEMKNLVSIFDKFENVSEEKKVLPFSPGTFDLSRKEEEIMIQQGLLKRDGDKYYLPEIIRHALKFKYQKGARPKVLSLLFK